MQEANCNRRLLYEANAYEGLLKPYSSTAHSLFSFILPRLRPVREHLLHVDRSPAQRLFFKMRVDVRGGLVVGVAHDLHGDQRVDAAFVEQRHVVVPEIVRGQRRLDLLGMSSGRELPGVISHHSTQADFISYHSENSLDPLWCFYHKDPLHKKCP